MVSSLKRAVRPRFIAAQDGARFTTYDLTGRGQLIDAVHQRLSAVTDALALHLTRELRQLLGRDALRVTCHGWQPTIESWPELMIGATTPEAPGTEILLGLDRGLAFGLSELFFGGDPGKLTEQQLAARTLADTERRLCQRVFDYILKFMSAELELPRKWRSNWLESVAPQVQQNQAQPKLWCSVAMQIDGWTATMVMGWPLAGIAQSNDREENFPDLRAQLEQRLRAMPTRLKIRVATLTLPLAELSQLRAGDILPLDLSQEVVACAGDMTYCKGLICEDGDRLAFKLTQLMETRQ